MYVIDDEDSYANMPSNLKHVQYVDAISKFYSNCKYALLGYVNVK